MTDTTNKPDESRLLTDEELIEASRFDAEGKWILDEGNQLTGRRQVAKAQDAKTASILKAQIEERDKRIAELQESFKMLQELSKAECQERVERIFREIEEGNVLRISTLGDWWQALKKQEGVGK